MAKNVRITLLHSLLPALIFVVALLPRLAPSGRYVTPDEPVWAQRSIRFSQALARGDLRAIPNDGHPGVTTMWLGAAGLQIHRWLDPERAAGHLAWVAGLAGLSPDSPEAYRHLAFFLPAGRALVALSASLGLVAVFVLARRLWGDAVAALGALLLALDPFLAGHSGLLHLDGLLATAMTLSALAALVAVCGLARGSVFYRWIALSGLLAGLALLTKTPGGFLALWVGFLLLAAWLTRRVRGRRAIVALVVWALAAGLTFLALFPALWVAPLATMRDLFNVGGRHVKGALRPIFFHGQITYDPGPAFYPVVWLFRVSPLAFFGLPVALVAHLRRPGSRRFAVLTLLALALGFGLFVTLVGKKHDRYLLPAFPPLTLVAAFGWEEIGELGISKLGIGRLVNWVRATNSPISSLLFVLVLIQLAVVLPYLFAPLGYFNPLLGGPRAALGWLPVGWGEGLGAAARWLNQQPEAERLIVATPSIPSFASLFAGQTAQLGPKTLSQADYVVNLPQGGDQTLFEEGNQAPLYENKIGGISHASVTRNSWPDEQVAYLSDRAREGDFIILDAQAALDRLYDGPAEVLVLADARDAAQVAARLDALSPDRASAWYVALPAASPIIARHIQEQLACRGQLVFSDTVAGATISQISLNTPQDSQPCDVSRFTSYVSRFGDPLALTDALLPSQPVAWPEPLPLVVRWAALAPLPADYRAILYLLDESGRVWAEGGRELLDADYRRPTAWSPGDWSDQTFELNLPAAIPPGRYSVELGLFDPIGGARLSAWDAQGDFSGLVVNLGQVSIAPPPNPPTPWDMVIAERLDPSLAAGPLVLLGHNPPPAQVASGDRVSFDLFWQTTSAPGADYAMRWQLSSLAGSVVLAEKVPLSPYPTTHWRDRELLQVRYDLPVPPDLPAGDYVLSVNVLNDGDAPLWDEGYALANVEVLTRDRLFSLPKEIDYPLDLRLGTLVHLRGFDLLGPDQADGDTLIVNPGDEIPLTLYWQADGPTDLSYAVFVHLVGPDGMLHGQVDRPPANGAAPTHTWVSGQVVVDEVRLPVLEDAFSGAYHIAVGLFDPLSGDRLPVYDAAGAALPDGQVILPVEVRVE